MEEQPGERDGKGETVRGLTDRSSPIREQDIHLNKKGKMSVGKEVGMAKRKT